MKYLFWHVWAGTPHFEHVWARIFHTCQSNPSRHYVIWQRTVTIYSDDMFGPVPLFPHLSIKPCLDIKPFCNVLLLFIMMIYSGTYPHPHLSSKTCLQMTSFANVLLLYMRWLMHGVALGYVLLLKIYPPNDDMIATYTSRNLHLYISLACIVHIDTYYMCRSSPYT